MEDIQNRQHKLKDPVDSVKVAQGDVMKFGRVRFRVKKLVVADLSNIVPIKEDLKNGEPSSGQKMTHLNIDTMMNDRRLSEMSIGQDT